MFSKFLFGQETKIQCKQIEFIDLKADNFYGYDNFGFYYYSKNNAFFKQKKLEIYQYQNINLGDLTQVDFINPLKILLFYRNFNAVVLVDNFLSETTQIHFSELTKPISCKYVGYAEQNKLWLVQDAVNQIGLFDLKTNFYQTIVPSFDPNITEFQSDFSTIQGYNATKNNWMNISLYGNITPKSDLSLPKNLQFLADNKAIFLKEASLFFVNLKTKQQIPIEIVEKSIRTFYYHDQILSIFTGKGITNYKTILP